MSLKIFEKYDSMGKTLLSIVKQNYGDANNILHLSRKEYPNDILSEDGSLAEGNYQLLIEYKESIWLSKNHYCFSCQYHIPLIDIEVLRYSSVRGHGWKCKPFDGKDILYVSEFNKINNTNFPLNIHEWSLEDIMLFKFIV